VATAGCSISRAAASSTTASRSDLFAAVGVGSQVEGSLEVRVDTASWAIEIKPANQIAITRRRSVKCDIAAGGNVSHVEFGGIGRATQMTTSALAVAERDGSGGAPH